MKRFFITALLASVLLGVIAFRISHHSHGQGLSVGIVVARCSSPEQLRMIRLQIEDDGSLSIDNNPITAGELSRRLPVTYEDRWEKVLFFEADDSVSYQQVATAIDIVQTAVSGITLTLITPSTRESCDREGIIRRIPI
jgi:biopolymer transport protein ExbD